MSSEATLHTFTMGNVIREGDAMFDYGPLYERADALDSKRLEVRIESENAYLEILYRRAAAELLTEAAPHVIARFWEIVASSQDSVPSKPVDEKLAGILNRSCPFQRDLVVSISCLHTGQKETTRCHGLVKLAEIIRTEAPDYAPQKEC